MKVWLPIFFAIFVLAEAFQWFKALDLPTPIFVGAGVILAIASNWERRAGIPFKWFRALRLFEPSEPYEPPEPAIAQTPAVPLQSSVTPTVKLPGTPVTELVTPSQEAAELKSELEPELGLLVQEPELPEPLIEPIAPTPAVSEPSSTVQFQEIYPQRHSQRKTAESTPD